MCELPLRIEILDCLVDAPSSFAALYGELGKRRRERIDIERLFELILEAESNGWVRTVIMYDTDPPRTTTDKDRDRVLREYIEWLPEAEYDELSCDEVGFWMEITPTGRELWTEVAKPTPSAEWTLADDVRLHRVVVKAANLGLAEEAIMQWNRLYPENCVQHRSVRDLDWFELRSGNRVENGIEVQVTYSTEK